MTTETQEAQTPPPWIPSADTFGARLALVRQHMGWGNVEKAARACGVPVETWRSWERDNRLPSRLTTIAMTIANRTGCDYLWLVHGPERGGSIRSSAYVGQRVLRKIGDPRTDRPNIPAQHHPPTNRSVRQTRPVVGAFTTRPLTPAAV